MPCTNARTVARAIAVQANVPMAGVIRGSDFVNEGKY
ncbi:UNVERIFIED_ORG: hypothetical protein ABIB19_003848 [Arthrobacter sp. UYEF10]